MNAIVSPLRFRPMPAFEVGQVWAAREPAFGAWTIVAITEHNETPVVAQAHHGGACSFTRDGQLSNHRSNPLDLVTLVSEAPDYATEVG